MVTNQLKLFLLGVVALVFLFATPGLVRADDDFDPTVDDFCTCSIRCCAFAEERILEDPILTAGNDDDDFEFPEMGVWQCVTCPFGGIFLLGEDDDDDGAPTGFNQMRPIGDRDGDKICDDCDNCPDDPNGITVVQDVETCEEQSRFCRFQDEIFKEANSSVVDEPICFLVDQADSNNDGIGDACTEDEPPPAPPAAPPTGDDDDDGGGQGTAINCLTGGGPGGFNNGTCVGCSITGSGTTPWQVIFGIFAIGFAPWVLRRSWVKIRG